MNSSNILSKLQDNIKRVRELPRLIWGLVFVAFLLGMVFAPRQETPLVIDQHDHEAEQAEFWTCSMHPSVMLSEPGQCPICGMDLIPVAGDSGGDTGLAEIEMTASAIALAQIMTTPVIRKIAKREVRLSGQVDYDETRVKHITSWMPGRLDRLYVDYTGISVKKGDHLAEIYSPDLNTAQEELIQAASQDVKSSISRATLAAAREKLRLLGLTSSQISAIEKRGTATDHMTIYSPESGIIIEKAALEGTYVSTGSHIYTIADLSRVWVILDAYESDLPWIHYGQEVTITVAAIPGRKFLGRIAFVEPFLNERTRTVKVRISLQNEDSALKPGMFVRATIQSILDRHSRAINPAMAGKWVGPMHPEIVSDKPGKCEICGMPLERAEDLGIVNAPAEEELSLVIPASAVLLTGKRAVVYIQKSTKDKVIFEGREVILGARAGDYYIVLEGLREGDQVVVNGAFKIDSAMQIAAKPSMMNPAERVEGKSIQMGDSPNLSIMKMQVSGETMTLLHSIYGTYFKLQNELASDRDDSAWQYSQSIMGSFNDIVKVNAGNGHLIEMLEPYGSALNHSTQNLSKGDNIDQFRAAFEGISIVVMALEESFGHSSDQTFYRIHCPMAFDAKGADWLQTDAEVSNPFYGDVMPTCGTVVDARPGISAGEAK